MTPLEELLAANLVHPELPPPPTKRDLSRQRVADRWVYFMLSDDGAVKIGSAGNPWTRHANIQASNPRRIRLLGFVPGGGELETELHRLLAGHRLRGEWFETAPAVLLCIREKLRGPRAIVGDRKWLEESASPARAE